MRREEGILNTISYFYRIYIENHILKMSTKWGQHGATWYFFSHIWYCWCQDVFRFVIGCSKISSECVRRNPLFRFFPDKFVFLKFKTTLTISALWIWKDYKEDCNSYGPLTLNPFIDFLGPTILSIGPLIWPILTYF